LRRIGKTAELSGKGYSKPLPFFLNNRKINIKKCHSQEGITKEIIREVLERATTKYPNVHRGGRYGKILSSYFVTELIQNLPPIRLTIIFRERENEILVTNAFLGSVNYRNVFEKNYKIGENLFFQKGKE
jgi:hypothetical protein